jgi:hypothetical protein
LTNAGPRVLSDSTRGTISRGSPGSTPAITFCSACLRTVRVQLREFNLSEYRPINAVRHEAFPSKDIGRNF